MANKLHTKIVRVQVLIEQEEREAFRQVAEHEGKSLSRWLRESALHRLEEKRASAILSSAADLRAFFKACRIREEDREPDWEEHLRIMEESRAAGRSRT